MELDAGHPDIPPEPLRVERVFQGSVFDVMDARRFARVTTSWWGTEPGPVEELVEELARRAVCGDPPGFKVVLTLRGQDVQVRVDTIGPDEPLPDGPARLRPTISRDPLRRS